MTYSTLHILIVLGSGELRAHDLMAPYIILRDSARKSSVADLASSFSSFGLPQEPKKHNRNLSGAQSSQGDFLSYVDKLLERHEKGDSLGLLSPTEQLSRRTSTMEELSAKEAIEFAILRGTSVASASTTNRFEISRNEQKVAIITIARPAYRLGESLIVSIDFTGSEIPCYAIHASLESAEKVDPAISLRSSVSIHRVSRRVHFSHSESTLYARRVSFSPTIPVMATPEFVTSGISLKWSLRIEFITPARPREGENESSITRPKLIEEVMRDDRGTTFAAIEGISCESFEVSLPLRVYGAVVSGREEAKSEGLAV
jgi:RAB6A-GEF complex partner protein 2